MLLPEGQTPAYLGQAVAILIYQDFSRFRFAKDKLQFNDAVVRYGARHRAAARAIRGVRRASCASAARRLTTRTYFPAVKQGPFSPTYENHEPVWPAPARDGDVGAQGMYYANAIARGDRASAARLAGADARLRHAIGRHRRARAGQRQRLVRRRAAGAASGRADAIAAGGRGERRQHAGQEPHRPEAAVPAPVLHGRLRIEGSLQHAVLRSRRRDLWRRRAGAARQRPLRAVPDRA